MQKSLVALLVAMSLSACGGSDKNSPPNFSQNSYVFNVNEDSVVQGQLSATDPDNDSLSFSVEVTTNNGVLTLNPAVGTITYTPKPNFHGTDIATIMVSDGMNSATTTVNFTIASVNDSPVYISHSLESGSAGSILGQISTTDVDGDSVSYSLAAQPALGYVELGADGRFVYTPNELALIDDKFSVVLSDGKSNSTAEINLVSQYSTNLDKLSYYYASDYSFLKQAEQLANGISDTASTDEIYQQLAVGYYQAGFTERAQALIDDNIAQISMQAEGLKALGDAERTKGNYAKAGQFYGRAFETYNQAMAEKGFANISSTRVS